MKPIVKRAKIRNWGSNVGKSIKYASIDLMKSTVPFTASTTTSAAEMARDVRSTLYKTKVAVNSQSSAISTTNLGKKARQLAEDALNDLKSGNLVIQNASRDVADNYKDSDFDFDFDLPEDFGSSGGANMAGYVKSQAKIAGMQADQISKSVAVGNAATIEALQASTSALTKTQMRGNQMLSAQIVNLGLMGINAQAQQMQVVNNQLEAMNKNLVNLVQFNNDNVSPSNQAMLSYFDKSLEIMERLDKSISDKETNSRSATSRSTSSSDKFPFLSNGFNMKDYGKFAKKNFDNTLVGSAISMLKLMKELDSMDGGKKPVRIMDKVTRFAVKAAIPTGLTKQLEKTDKNVSRFIKSALMDLGDKQYDYSQSGFKGMATRFLASIFGVERTRTKNISMGNFYKDQMSWNGMANRILIEAIPSYLANIEAALTKKERRYYDPQTGRFKKESKIIEDYDSERDTALQSALYPVLSKLNDFLEDNGISESRRGNVQDQLNTLLNKRVAENYNDADFKHQIAQAFSGVLNSSQFQQVTLGMEESLEEAMKSLDELRQSIEKDHDKLGYRQVNNAGLNLDQRNRTRVTNMFGISGRNRDFFSTDLSSTIMGYANQYISPEEAAKGFSFKLEPAFLQRFQKETLRSDDPSYLSKFVQKEVNIQKQKFFRESVRKRFNMQSVSQRFAHVGESAADRIANFDADVYSRVGGYGGFVPLNSEYGGEGENVGAAGSRATNPNFRDTVKDLRGRAANAGREVKTKVTAATSRLRSSAGSLRSNDHIRRAQANITAIDNSNFEEADLDSLARNQDEIDKGVVSAQAEFEGEERAGVSSSDQKMSSFMSIMTGTLLSMQNSFTSIFSGVFGKKGIIHKIWDSDWRKQFTKDLADKLFNEEHGILKDVTKHGKDALDYEKYLWSGKGYTNRYGKVYEDTDNNAKQHLKSGYNKFYDLAMRGAFGDKYEEDEFFQKHLSKWRFDLSKKAPEADEAKIEGISESTKPEEPKVTEPKKPTAPSAEVKGLPSSSNEKENDTVALEMAANPFGLPDFTAEIEKAKAEVDAATEDLANAVKETSEDIRKSSENFTDAIFGEDHKDPEKQKKSFLSNFKSNLPKMAAAGIAGAGLVLASGGTMGLLGGLFLPNSLIGGAIVGMGVQLASKSQKFNEFVFGKEDEDGKKKGGLISNRMQNAFKKALPAAAIGAVLGAGKSMIGLSGGLPGMGLLTGTLLPGGILGGAILGMGVSLVKNSDTFQNIVFGKKDDEGKRQGILAKGFRSVGDKMKSISPKLKSGLKGLAVGAVTGATLSHMGVLGSALSLGGPVGMGIAGLGFGILSSTKRFNEYLFGHEELDANGNPTGKRLEDGLLPRLKNLVTVNVLDPIKQQIEDSVTNFAYWAKDKITYPFRLAFGPVLDALGGLKDDIGDFVKDKFEVVGEGISNIFKKTFDTITQPITKLLGTIGRMAIKTLAGTAKLALSPVTMGLNAARLLTSPARAKSEFGFVKAYGGTVRDQLQEQWDGKKRSLVGKAFDTAKLLGNKDARLAAREAWEEGMGLNGMNHLNWRGVRGEKKADKEAKKARINWRPIDKLRQQYVKEDRGNGSVYWSDKKMEKMRKAFLKRGINEEDISTEADLRDLIFHKDDWKDKVADRKSQVAEAGMAGVETPEQAEARKNTTKFENDTTGLLQNIYNLMLKNTQDEAEHQRAGKSKKKLAKHKNRLLKKLNKMGINPKKLGIDDVLDYQDMSDQDWELFRDSEEYKSGDFDGWYKKNLWRWNAGVEKSEGVDIDSTPEAGIPTPESDENVPESDPEETPLDRMRKMGASWARENMSYVNRMKKREARRAAKHAKPGQVDILDKDGSVIASAGDEGTNTTAAITQLSDDIREQNTIAGEQLQAQLDTNEALYPPGTYDRNDRMKDISGGKASSIKDEFRDAASTTASELTSSVKKGMTSAMSFMEEKKAKLFAKFKKNKKESEETDQARALGDIVEEPTEEGKDTEKKESGEGSTKKTSFLGKLFGAGKGILGTGLGILSAGGGLLKKLLFGKGKWLSAGIIGALLMNYKEENPEEFNKYMTGAKNIVTGAKDGLVKFWDDTAKPFFVDTAFPAILNGLGLLKDLFVEHIPNIVEGVLDMSGKLIGGIFEGIWNFAKKKMGGGKDYTPDGIEKDIRDANGAVYHLNPETGKVENVLGSGKMPIVDEQGNFMLNSDGTTSTMNAGMAGTKSAGIHAAATIGGQFAGTAGQALVEGAGKRAAVQAGIGASSTFVKGGVKAASSVGKAGGKVVGAVAGGPKKIIKGLFKLVKDAFKKLMNLSAVTKLFKKMGADPKVLEKTAEVMVQQADDAMEKAGTAIVEKAATRVSNETAEHVAKDATTAVPPVKVVVEVGFGIWNGVTGWMEAARLFDVPKDDVDWKMSLISALYKVITGLPFVWIFDLLFELWNMFTGFDPKKWLATSIYKLIETDDSKVEALLDAQVALEIETQNYNLANGSNLSASQYSDMKNKTVAGGVWNSITGKDKTNYSQYAATDAQMANYYTQKSTGASKQTAINSSTMGYGTGKTALGYGEGPSKRTSTTNSRKSIGYAEIPNVSQSDPRWSDYTLGTLPNGETSTMANGGCGPTALASVASAITKSDVSPVEVASYAKSKGFIAQGGATEDLFTSGASKLGLKAHKLDSNNVVNGLASGKPVVLAGRSNSNDPNATPFTKAGHIVTATGLDANGNVKINDPRSGQTRSYPLGLIRKNMTTAFSYDKGTPAAGYGITSLKKKRSFGYGRPDEDSVFGDQKAQLRDEIASLDTQIKALSGGNNGYANAKKVADLKEKQSELQAQLSKLLQAENGTLPANTNPKSIQDTWETVGKKKFADVGLPWAIPREYTKDWLTKFKQVTDPEELMNWNKSLDSMQFLKFRKAQMTQKIYNYTDVLDGMYTKRLGELVANGTSSVGKANNVLNPKAVQEEAKVVYGLSPAWLYPNKKAPNSLAMMNTTNNEMIQKIQTQAAQRQEEDEYTKYGLKKWDDLTVINGMPYYSLADPEWADLPYRGGTVSTKGKDLVMLAQMLSTYTKKGITPKYLLTKILPQADQSIYSTSNGISAGIQWDKMFDPTKGIQNMKELYDKNDKPLKISKMKIAQSDFYSKLKDGYPILMNGTEYTGSPFGGEGDKFSGDTEMWGGAGIGIYGGSDALHMINPYTTIDNPVSALMSTLTDLGGPTFTQPLTRDTAYMMYNSEPERPFKIPEDVIASMTKEEAKMVKKAEGNTVLNKAKNGLSSLLDFFKKFASMGQELFMSKMEGRDYERQLDDEGNLINKEEAEMAQQTEAVINEGLLNGEIGNNGDPYIQGDDYVGKYVKRFESGNKGSTAFSKCGNDGGGSYGSYQMIYGGAGDSARRFWKKYYAAQYGDESSAMDLKEKWQAAAMADPAGFFANEHQFISDTYYKPARAKIAGVDPDQHSRMLQESLWSWSVHRGPTTAANEFNEIGIADPKNMPASEMVDKIYDKRGSVMRKKGWASIADGRYGKGKDSERATLSALGNQAPLFNTATNTTTTSTTNAAGMKTDEATEFGNKLREALAKKYGIPANKLSTNESAKREYANLSKQASSRVAAGESYAQVSESILASIVDGTSSKNKGTTSTTTAAIVDSGRSTVHTSASGRQHGGGGRSFGFDDAGKLSGTGSSGAVKSVMMPVQALNETAKHFNCSPFEIQNNPERLAYYTKLMSGTQATGNMETATAMIANGYIGNPVATPANNVTMINGLNEFNPTFNPNQNNLMTPLGGTTFGTFNPPLAGSTGGLRTTFPLGYGTGMALGWDGEQATDSIVTTPAATTSFTDYLNEKTEGGKKNLSMEDMFDSFKMLGDSAVQSRMTGEDYSTVLTSNVNSKKATPQDTGAPSGTQSSSTPVGSNGGKIDNTPYASTRQAVVNALLSRENKNSYTMGSQRTQVGSGFGDCSATVQWALRQGAGVDPGGNTGTQYTNPAAQVVDRTKGGPAEGNLYPGDLLYYQRLSDYTSGRKDRVGHVEMYIGNGQRMGHGSGIGPKKSALNSDGARYLGALRFVGATPNNGSATGYGEAKIDPPIIPFDPKKKSKSVKPTKEIATYSGVGALGYGENDTTRRKLNLNSLMEDALDTPIDDSISDKMNLMNSNGGRGNSYFGEAMNAPQVVTPAMATQAPREKAIEEKINVAVNAEGVENKLDGILGVMKEWYGYSKQNPGAATGSYYGDNSITINNQNNKGGAKNVVLGGPAKIGTDLTQDRMRKIHESIAKKKF